VRQHPNVAKLPAGITRRVVRAQRFRNLGQHPVLPANEDVASALVVVDQLGDALLVLLGARRVNHQPEVLGQGLDGLKRSGAIAVWKLALASVLRSNKSM